MKLIHTADLHLDSKMESNLPQEKAQERREELLSTYERMVRYAADHDVRVIMIAGDLFDKRHNRRSARMRVLEQIQEHPEIDFLYLCGNHDDVDFLADEDPEDIPENLKRFTSDSWTSYTYGDLVISGRELTAENSRVLATNLVLDQAKTNIVMLHGQESEHDGSGKAEIINRNDLKDHNINYLALGHVHSYKEGRLDDRGIWVYSGCPEGRGFDECGEKGFVLLDVQDGKIAHSFVPFAARTIREINVNLTPDLAMMDILHLAEDALADIPEQDMVRLVLSGKTAMDLDLDLRRIQRKFEERFWFFTVLDRSTVQVNYESFREDRSLKGEFVRLLEQEETLTEDEKSRIVETGMRAILGEDIEG